MSEGGHHLHHRLALSHLLPQHPPPNQMKEIDHRIQKVKKWIFFGVKHVVARPAIRKRRKRIFVTIVENMLEPW